MFEKVNPSHPDKVADRIAGALVDYVYSAEENPRIAVEVLLGHGVCHIIAETSVNIPRDFVGKTVARIAGITVVDYVEVPQDVHLAANQGGRPRCGDNDGKQLISCQSNAKSEELRKAFPEGIINPLGDWTGGSDVDSGATNRKLGSDMGDSVTGGGLHGKDLSKADVSVNIYAWLKAQETGKTVEMSCAIGDDAVGGVSYGEIVEVARKYIKGVGGFEKFAEWGLI